MRLASNNFWQRLSPPDGWGTRSALRFRLLAGLLFLAGSFGNDTHAQPTAREYDLKAAFLFNFTQFVEWPPEALPQEGSPFVIGILGHDPFGSYLDDLVRNERAQGRLIVVRRFSRIEEAAGAQVLFISRSEQARLESILDYLRGKPILTVSEVGSRSFLRQGGAISLVMESNRVRIWVNPDAAKSAQLTISTKLLRIAEVVR